MAEAALSMAVEKLGSLAIQKASELRNVEKQVTRLKDELQMMQSFLRDAAEKQAKDETVRKWISDVREVAFDTEDVIDTFALKVLEPRKSRGLLGRCVGFPEHVYHLDKLGQEIESIQNRLKDIEERRVRFGIQGLNAAAMVSSDGVKRGRRVSPWHKDKRVVGFEEHVEVLLREAVLGEEVGLSFTSIVGMGGVGKSTLAKTIYNHAAVGKQFDRRAWVTVTREFNPKELLKELVRQLRPRKGEQLRPREGDQTSPDDISSFQASMNNSSFKASMTTWSEESLECAIQDLLRGNRYFIVLDDVWKHEHWAYIVNILPEEFGKASRLLITSRVDNILSVNVGHVLKLECLGLEESWKLFLTSIDECPRELEDIGKEIVKRCYGLPLAITIMAGLLLGLGKSERAWEQVWKGMRYHSEAGEYSLRSVLELSYWDLPPHLKSCFLCLSFFKEDALIDARTLIQLWIAESIIPCENEKATFEEIAQCYLNELINRNIVQVVKLAKDGQVKYCQIHDLLKDLSLKKAMEEIKFNILNNENVSDQSLDKPRHLSIYHNNKSFISSRSPIPHLRSLFMRVSASGDDCIPMNLWERLEGCVRVLELGGLGLTKVPTRIGMLVELKYLRLCNNQIRKLPRSLGHLNHLQMLDISENITNVDVPNVLWKLESLRHLYMSQHIFCKEPLRLDTLKNLQTLVSDVSTENIVVEHLAQMVSLRELSLCLARDADVNELFFLLAKLENLVSLSLSWCMGKVLSLDGIVKLQHITELRIFGRLAQLPKSFPQKLSYLKLAFTYIKEDPMPMLGRLPNLSCLSLFVCAYVGEDMVIECNGFPGLEVLNLVYMPKLRQISIEKGGLPKLKRLKIFNCRDVNILPKEEENRMESSLQSWKISGTNIFASVLKDFVEAALTVMVEMLGDQAIRKVFSMLKVDAQVTGLKDELSMLQRYLKDDENVRGWASSIMMTAIDTVEVIESFTLKIHPRWRSRHVLGQCASFPRYVSHIYSLGQEIKPLRERVKGITEELTRHVQRPHDN